MPGVDIATGLEVTRNNAEELSIQTETNALRLASVVPVEQTIAVGTVTVVGGIVTSVDAMGFSGVVRVSAGRARFLFDTAQPDANFLVQVTARNSTDCAARVSNQTAQYVEVRTNALAGILSDPAAFNIKVTRIVRS
jgi:hypothetical protein